MSDVLRNRTILLGVTGGIAAYKAAEIASRLVKLEAVVEVVMTEAATRFVTPITFESITHRNAFTCMWAAHTKEPTHISLAERIDAAVIAPATANTLAKLAYGLADNLLTGLLLATRAPVLVAPAMNDGMYSHPATQANLALLKERGVRFVGPDEGRLACGTVGVGRMAEPAAVIEALAEVLESAGDREGAR